MKNKIEESVNNNLVGRKIKWGTGLTKNAYLTGNIVAIQKTNDGIEALVEVTNNTSTKEVSKKYPLGKLETVSLFNAGGCRDVYFIKD